MQEEASGSYHVCENHEGFESEYSFWLQNWLGEQKILLWDCESFFWNKTKRRYAYTAVHGPYNHIWAQNWSDMSRAYTLIDGSFPSKGTRWMTNAFLTSGLAAYQKIWKIMLNHDHAPCVRMAQTNKRQQEVPTGSLMSRCRHHRCRGNTFALRWCSVLRSLIPRHGRLIHSARS